MTNVTVLNDPHESKIILERKKISSEESFYECKISNRWGEDKRSLLVKINDTKSEDKGGDGKDSKGEDGTSGN